MFGLPIQSTIQRSSYERNSPSPAYLCKATHSSSKVVANFSHTSKKVSSFNEEIRFSLLADAQSSSQIISGIRKQVCGYDNTEQVQELGNGFISKNGIDGIANASLLK